MLVPRPDSETLIAAAVEHFAGTPGPKRILDLGTGPGHAAARRARRMAQARPGSASTPRRPRWPMPGATPRASGMADAGRVPARRLGRGASSERFDLILCNPPYVADGRRDWARSVAEYEPAEALFAGPEGLDDYRRLAPEVGRLLAPGGLAAIEIGFDQADSASPRCSRRRALHPRLARDLGGRPARAADQGLSRKGLEFGACAHYIVVQGRGRSHENRSAPATTPDDIAALSPACG